MNNQPAPEWFLRLSSKWLETNPLPKDAMLQLDDGELAASSFRGEMAPAADLRNGTVYLTARTDLPREAYADSDEIRPMTHEERKALDEFTMKELTESETAPGLTQPGLPKAGLTQPEVASTSEEFINGVESVLLIRCTDCLLVPQQNRNEHGGGECGGCIAKERDTLRAQLEAKEAECREFRGIVHQLDRRDALAGFKTVGDKISALLKIAAAADPKAELAKSIMENDKLRAEVEGLKADRERLDWLENPLRFTLEQSVELRVLNPDDKGNYFEFSIREVMPLDEFYACLTLRSAIDAARAATEEGK